MAYQIAFTPAARRQLAKLPATASQALGEVIQALSANPKPAQARLLVNARSLWRVKSGDYRVLYRIEEDRLLVLVVKVAHRKEAYRNLDRLE